MHLFVWTLAATLSVLGRSRAAVTNDSAHCTDGERRVDVADLATPARALPFRDGEQLEYSVSYTKVRAGSGTMRIVADSLRGARVWRASLAVDGGIPFLSVHDTNTSWFEQSSFTSLRFLQQQHEPRHTALRDFHIFPERRAFQPIKGPEQPSVVDPMDEVSIVYFVRTLALEPGECFELHRYFKPGSNPVVVHVERRERIEVPAGTYNAIVVRPEIVTSGIFSENGRAELWLSDDAARLVLQLKTHLSIGSINLYLKRATNTVAPTP